MRGTPRRAGQAQAGGGGCGPAGEGWNGMEPDDRAGLGACRDVDVAPLASSSKSMSSMAIRCCRSPIADPIPPHAAPCRAVLLEPGHGQNRRRTSGQRRCPTPRLPARSRSGGSSSCCCNRPAMNEDGLICLRWSTTRPASDRYIDR